MKNALRVCLVLAALACVTWTLEGEQGRVTRGGMSAAGTADTTYTFDPGTAVGVDLLNPDAEATFVMTNGNGDIFTAVLPGNSSKPFYGNWVEVFVNRSTTQKVGVFALD